MKVLYINVERLVVGSRFISQNLGELGMENIGERLIEKNCLELLCVSQICENPAMSRRFWRRLPTVSPLTKSDASPLPTMGLQGAYGSGVSRTQGLRPTATVAICQFLDSSPVALPL